MRKDTKNKAKSLNLRPSFSSVCSRHRRKNVKRCQAVSHAALRDDSGHGWESEVKAITSWVAPLSDLWPSLHCALSVFSLRRFKLKLSRCYQVYSSYVQAHAKLQQKKKRRKTDLNKFSTNFFYFNLFISIIHSFRQCFAHILPPVFL